MKNELEKWKEYLPRSSGRTLRSLKLASDLQPRHRKAPRADTNATKEPARLSSPGSSNGVALLVLGDVVVVADPCGFGPALASERRIRLYREGQGHVQSFVRLHHPTAHAAPLSTAGADVCDELRLPVQRVAAVSFHVDAGAVSFDLGFTVSLRCLQVDPDEGSVWGGKKEKRVFLMDIHENS